MIGVMTRQHGKMMTGAAAGWVLGLCGVLLCAGAWGALDEPARRDLASAFSALDDAGDTETTEKLLTLLESNPAADPDWPAFFADYFKDHALSSSLMQFWDMAIRRNPAEGRYLFLSVQCTMQAFAVAVAPRDAKTGTGTEAGPDSGTQSGTDTPETVSAAALPVALPWLVQAAPMLTAEQRALALTGLTATLKGRKIDVTPLLLQTPPQVDAERARLGMQMCLMLCAYVRTGPQQGPGGNTGGGARPPELTSYLTLPERVAYFWRKHGVFVFDNNGLTPAHTEILDSLLASFPWELHYADALTVGEFYHQNPLDMGLVSVGSLVPIAPIALNVTTAPGEWSTRRGGPVVPEFAASAAVSLVRTIQAVQFSQRPYLAAWRDALLDRYGAKRAAYLRQTVPPAVYLEQPDELLPLTAYLWCIDSAYAFHTALDFLVLSEEGPIEALLLLADMLSGGGPVSLVAGIAPMGIVSSGPAPIGRLSGSSGPINSIEVRGKSWAFLMNEFGEVGGLVNQRWPEVLF